MILAPSVVVIAEDTGPNHRSPRGQGLDNDKHPSSPGPSTGAVAPLRHAPAPAPPRPRYSPAPAVFWRPGRGVPHFMTGSCRGG